MQTNRMLIRALASTAAATALTLAANTGSAEAAPARPSNFIAVLYPVTTLAQDLGRGSDGVLTVLNTVAQTIDVG